MTVKGKINLSIVNALMWAAVIIATALITTDTLSNDDQTMILILHVVGWFAVEAAIRKAKS